MVDPQHFGVVAIPLYFLKGLYHKPCPTRHRRIYRFETPDEVIHRVFFILQDLFTIPASVRK